MTIQEVQQIVNHKDTRKYLVTTKDGRKYYKRLWMADDGIGILNQRAKHWGRYLTYYQCENWTSMRPFQKRKVDHIKRMKKRASDALKMLNESGLWPSIKKEIEYFLSNEEIIKQVCEDIEAGKLYEECMRGRHKEWAASCSYAIFEAFYGDRCWKSINHTRYWRDSARRSIATAISEKKNYNDKWRNGYDCSVEVRFDDDGTGRAWYSEEYVGCLNGWYYLMFDATHAIFYEKD